VIADGRGGSPKGADERGAVPRCSQSHGGGEILRRLGAHVPTGTQPRIFFIPT
jgi:hypothetical protein